MGAPPPELPRIPPRLPLLYTLFIVWYNSTMPANGVVLMSALVLLLCVFLAGWVGATAKYRSLRRRQLDLEYRLTDLEGKVIREQKIRANTESLKSRTSKQDLLDFAQEHANDGDSKAAAPVTTPHFQQWWRQKLGNKQ